MYLKITYLLSTENSEGKIDSKTFSKDFVAYGWGTIHIMRRIRNWQILGTIYIFTVVVLLPSTMLAEGVPVFSLKEWTT